MNAAAEFAEEQAGSNGAGLRDRPGMKQGGCNLDGKRTRRGLQRPPAGPMAWRARRTALCRSTLQPSRFTGAASGESPARGENRKSAADARASTESNEKARCGMPGWGASSFGTSRCPGLLDLESAARRIRVSLRPPRSAGGRHRFQAHAGRRRDCAICSPRAFRPRTRMKEPDRWRRRIEKTRLDSRNRCSCEPGEAGFSTAGTIA